MTIAIAFGLGILVAAIVCLIIAIKMFGNLPI